MNITTIFIIIFAILMAAVNDEYRRARRERQMETYRRIFDFFYNLFHMNTKKDSRTNTRKQALSIAKPFLTLKNKRNIWSDMILSNNFCIISLDKEGSGIRVVERKNQRRSFKIVSSHAYSIEELWNKLCFSFLHDTNYDGLLELMNTYKTEIMEANIYFPEQQKDTKQDYFEPQPAQIGINPKHNFKTKTHNKDTNYNDSEKEIQKTESNNPDETSPKIERNDERSVDL